LLFFKTLNLQVADPTVKLGEFEDLSKVEKFEMADDQYAKRAGKFKLLWSLC